MLSEISQSLNDRHLHTGQVLRGVGFLEAERRLAVPEAGRERSAGCVFKGFLGADERIPELDGGGDCMSVCVCLMPMGLHELNVLKMVRFRLCTFYHNI